MIDLLPEFRPLLADNRLMELGPGSPNVAAKPLLQELARELPKKAKDRAFALACLAGLWLYHNFLDESHAISQDLDTLEGSYWHAILHRREPDFWNSKYWFRRVPRHPVFSDLRNEAAVLAAQAKLPNAAFLVTQPAWDAAAFVDLCAAASEADLEILCRKVQRREWELLFTYCHQRAFR